MVVKSVAILEILPFSPRFPFECATELQCYDKKGGIIVIESII